MLAPVRCPLVQLMIGPSQAQSSGHEGHLHVHGTPTTVTDPWIGANTRTLLKSDWIGASDGTRNIFYIVIFALWVAAVAYSFSAYRRNREEERRIIAEAEAAAYGGDQDRPAAAPSL